MDTLIEILLFLIRVFGSIYLSVILLRFLLQTARADFYNPVSQLFVKLTNPVLIPLRRVIPGFWGVDIACLVFALIFHWLVMQLMMLVAQPAIPASMQMIAGTALVSPLWMLAWSVIGIILNITILYIVSGFVVAIASFVAPHSRHPILMLTRQLLEPLLAPVRRLIPPTGGMDLSLFFVSIGLIVIRMAVTGVAQSIGTPFSFLIGYT